MSRLLYAAFSVVIGSAFASDSGAREISAHWPLMEFAVYDVKPVGEQSRLSANESGAMGTGIGLPQVLVFSTEGALAWRGHPEDLDTSMFPVFAASKGSNEFERLLTTLDRAWTNIPDFRPTERLPSELVETGRPSLVLVVATLGEGACTPCESYLASFEASAPDWNRIVAALGQSTAH